MSNLRYLNSFGSPNASRINGPLAESTAIGSPLAQQSDSFRGNQKRKISPLANANKYRQPGVSIEPHVLTNAQSRGIVKRLVTYYDESQGDADKNNKYVYNRVGDFPIVQLKKTEIKKNLVRSSSMRIAPPSKAVFNRDIRAAILRSNSIQMGSNVPKIQPIKMRVNDESHQIITDHEPLPIDESPQTSKSVLDALEKNCRKRINNEELTLDRNKRVCAPQETVDGPSIREFIPITAQSAKRGREQTSPKSPGDSPNSQRNKKLRLKNNALLSSLSSSNFLQPTIMKPIAAPPARTLDEVEKTERKLKEAKVSSPPRAEPAAEEVKAPAKQPEKRLHLFNKRFDNSQPIVKRSYSFRDLDDDDEGCKIFFVKPREKTNQEVDLNSVRSVEKDRLNMMLSGLSENFKMPSSETPQDMVDSIAKQKPAAISFTTTTTTSTAAPITTPASASSTSQSSTILSSLVAPQKSPPAAEKPKEPVTIAAVKPQMSTAVSLAPPAASSSSTTSAPSFNFLTTPAKNLSAPSVDPNKSLMSFTPIAKPAATTSSEAVSATSTATTSAPSIPTLATGTFAFGAGKDTKEDPKPAPSFSFGSGAGSAVSTAATTTSSPAVPSFSFKPAGTPAFSFGATPAAATTTSTSSFTFGSTTSTSVGITPTPSVGITPASTASNLPTISGSVLPSIPGTATTGFSFGSPATTTSASTIPTLNFGGAATTPAGLGATTAKPLTSSISGITPLAGSSVNLNSAASFLQKPETTTASGVGFSFGAKDNTSTSSGAGFSFGASTPAVTSAPVATTSSFAFGGPAVTPAFGSPAVTAPPAFGATNSTPTFGSTTAAPTPAFGASAAPSNAFGSSGISAFGQPSFGAPAATSAPAFGATNTVTPTFGASSTGFTGFGQKSEPAQPASNGMFSFGQKTTAQETPAASTFSFGGATGGAQPSTGAFNFGQQQNAPQPAPASGGIFSRLGDKQPETKPAFAFGGNTSQPVSASPMFGAGATSPATANNSAFGTPTTNAPLFGSSFGQSNTQAQSPFGSHASQPSTADSNFNFKGFGASPAPTPQASSGPFSFGGNQNNSTASAPSVFGSNSGSNVSASFTFKPSTGTVSTNPSPVVFGQSQNSSTASAPFQFGGSQVSASASFNFSGGAANASSTGGFPSANNSSSGGFNFGAPQSAPVSGAFNFQGAPQPSLTPQPTAGGLFSIGTGGQRRPIRQATRRMK